MNRNCSSQGGRCCNAHATPLLICLPASSAEPDHYLSEMLCGLQIPVCCRYIIERKGLVDNRLEPTHRNSTVHRLEHLPGADRDALHICSPRKHQHWIDFSCP